MDVKEIVIALRFKRAAIRRLLADMGQQMDNQQRDLLLDEWNELTTLIEKLEQEF